MPKKKNIPQNDTKTSFNKLVQEAQALLATSETSVEKMLEKSIEILEKRLEQLQIKLAKAKEQLQHEKEKLQQEKTKTSNDRGSTIWVERLRLSLEEKKALLVTLNEEIYELKVEKNLLKLEREKFKARQKALLQFENKWEEHNEKFNLPDYLSD